MPPVISVKNLVKTYVVGEIEVRALRGVNLDVEPGEFLAVTGTSGSGSGQNGNSSQSSGSMMTLQIAVAVASISACLPPSSFASAAQA